MATNRLLEGQSKKPGRVTVEMLENMVMRYNQERWVVGSGKPYFVARRTNDDGTVTHYLDRNG